MICHGRGFRLSWWWFMKNSDNPLTRAAEVIKSGGIVVFPTETVYGLGADAFNERAVRKIFKVKGRPADNPLIVHIADRRNLKALAASVPAAAQKLMDAFWPGPLTIIFKKNPRVPDVVTAGLDTVAVRLPNHALARAFIRAAGVPIAAPSANRSGRPSPTEAIHAKRDLGSKVDFFLAAEKTKYGLESTVINPLARPPVILRPGAITREDIEKVIGPVRLADAGTVIQSPGMRRRHYSPQTPLVLSPADWLTAAQAIAALIETYHRRQRRVGVLATRENCPRYKNADRIIVVGSRHHLKTCAGNLFKCLRDFDRFADVDIILAETFPEQGIGAAIMDRLKRAARR